jgi:hypothetical protein
LLSATSSLCLISRVESSPSLKKHPCSSFGKLFLTSSLPHLIDVSIIGLRYLTRVFSTRRGGGMAVINIYIFCFDDEKQGT